MKLLLHICNICSSVGVYIWAHIQKDTYNHNEFTSANHYNIVIKKMSIMQAITMLTSAFLFKKMSIIITHNWAFFFSFLFFLICVLIDTQLIRLFFNKRLKRTTNFFNVEKRASHVWGWSLHKTKISISKPISLVWSITRQPRTDGSNGHNNGTVLSTNNTILKRVY